MGQCALILSVKSAEGRPVSPLKTSLFKCLPSTQGTHSWQGGPCGTRQEQLLVPLVPAVPCVLPHGDQCSEQNLPHSRPLREYSQAEKEVLLFVRLRLKRPQLRVRCECHWNITKWVGKSSVPEHGCNIWVTRESRCVMLALRI